MRQESVNQPNEQNVSNSDLLRALRLEQSSKTAASLAATHDETPVFDHLAESATRHIATLTELLERAGIDVPEHEPSDPVWQSTNAALEDAFRTEEEKADVYDRLVTASERTENHHLFFKLWQATARRHLPAIAHQLEQASPIDSTTPRPS